MAARLDDGGDDLDELHEINVTPFIDVILVLLIIFMVAAPLATVDVAVDLPRSTAAPQPRPDKPVYLTLREDLSLVLNDAAVDRTALKERLDSTTGSDAEQRVYLRADRNVDYGALTDVLNLLRAAGYLKIGLVGLEAAPPAEAALPQAP